MLSSSLWIQIAYNLCLRPSHLQKACLETGQYIRRAVRALPGSASAPSRTTLQLSWTTGCSGGVRDARAKNCYEQSGFSTLGKSARKLSCKHGNCPVPGLQRKKSCRWRVRSALWAQSYRRKKKSLAVHFCLQLFPRKPYDKRNKPAIFLCLKFVTEASFVFISSLRSGSKGLFFPS